VLLTNSCVVDRRHNTNGFLLFFSSFDKDCQPS